MRDVSFPLGVFVVVWTLLTFSSTQLPLTWDEGEMAARVDAASQGVWRGTVMEEGHPQFPIVLTALGSMVCPTFFSEETRLRFGVILWFSAALATVSHRLRREFSTETAVFGIISILLVPRLFAHAQIAAWDSPLTASWLFVWALFPRNHDSSFRVATLWGVFLGIAFASKFPGWAAPLPFVVWTLCRFRYYEIKVVDLGKRTLVIGVTALLVFFLLNPPLWGGPFDGLRIFFELNTQRELNISIMFLGKLYDLHHSLPWYNTLFWTVITVPVGLLGLFVVGLQETIRDAPKRQAGLLILLNMATPLILRALPGTPVHDGVRLFVTAFPFLAMLAAIGAASLWTTWKKRILIVTVYGACVFNMLWYAPQWLSFYNLAVGGLPGAVRIGMEPTYYWDALDQQTLDWINANTQPDECVVFSYGSHRTLTFYRCANRLQPEFLAVFEDILPDDFQKRNGRWYVLQRRTGMLLDHDQELIARHVPVYVKTIRNGGIGPWNLRAVPLLEIYELK